MKTVFADTVFWFAYINPRDQRHQSAKNAYQRLGAAQLITTDEILTEFLTLLSGRGPHMRQVAVETVQKLLNATLDDINVKVLPQSRDSFQRGLELYERRRDKKYSLPDCIAMNAMHDNGIREILTRDHHFEQERFTILMKDREI